MPEVDGDAGTSNPLFPDRKRGVWGQSDDGYGVAGTANSGNGVQAGSICGFGVVGTSDSSIGVFGISKGDTGVFGRSDLAGNPGVQDFRQGGIGVHGSNMLANGIGVFGEVGIGVGVMGRSDGGSGIQGSSQSGVGVDASSVNDRGLQASSQRGVAVWASSVGASGVEGHSGSPSAAGVRGVSSAGGNGVIGESTNVGIFAANTQANGARAWLASPGFAGDFHGNVNVTGHISKSGGGFAIDHPNPEWTAKKYLHHSFVESPDMKNVYDGVAVMNAKGEAVVELPEYFSLLNKDFRYQLTPLGACAPNLHIAEEIANNRFRIGGGSAGMRVSWQVTGIRQDPWANAHRIRVVEDKTPDEQGCYLHPKLYGQPSEKSVHYVRYEAHTGYPERGCPGSSAIESITKLRKPINV
jgi:hypothetical protein